MIDFHDNNNDDYILGDLECRTGDLSKTNRLFMHMRKQLFSRRCLEKHLLLTVKLRERFGKNEFTNSDMKIYTKATSSTTITSDNVSRLKN